MDYHKLSEYIIIIFIVLSLFCTITKRNRLLLILFVLGIGVGGFSIYWGTVWAPYKVVSIFILLIVILRKRTLFSSRYFILFVSLFILSFAIAVYTSTKFNNPELPFLQQSYMRPFVQLFTYVSIASLIPFSLVALKSSYDLNNFLKRYYIIVEFVMVFALLQFILVKLGIDFMPILRPNVIDSQTAAFQYGNQLVTRLYGITGEPKTLSAFIFPYFFIQLYTFSVNKINKNIIYHLFMIFLCLFIIINAFSSAVLISLAVGLLLTSLIWFRNNLKFFIPLILVVLGIQFINPETYTLAKGVQTTATSLSDYVYFRTVDRLNQVGEHRIDYVAIKYLFEDKPDAILTGFGMGMYPFYLDLGGNYGIEPIDSNWVVLLLDFGILGILIFLYFFYKVFELLNYKLFKRSIDYNTCLIALLSSYVLGMGVGSYIYIILFLALTLVIRRNTINEFGIKLRSKKTIGLKKGALRPISQI